jgi:uncharacterized protein (TIGR02996 family)
VDERRALMTAIIASPEEDTPRLALADWLQEHGDRHDQARAEFIRLQIEAVNAPPGRRRGELAKKAKDLLKKHRKKWLAPLGLLWGVYLDADVEQFSRGLLSSLFVEVGPFLSKRWQARLPDALAAVGVEKLYFWGPTKRPAALAASPAVRWVTTVDYPEADDAALAAFARSENFAHLSGLLLNEVRATDAGLRDFARHTRTANLTTIEVAAPGGRRNPAPTFTSRGVLALLKSDRLPRLKSLDVGAPTGMSFGLRGFLSDPALRKLEGLSVVMEVSAAEVIASPNLTNLRVLRLHGAAMTDADGEALLARRTFAKLEELSLVLDSPLSPAAQRKLKKRFGDKFSHNA